MKNCSLTWIVGMVSWTITSVVTLCRGLTLLGYQVPRVETLLMGSPGMVKPVAVLIALAGLYSFVMLVLVLFGVKKKDSCSPCGDEDRPSKSY